MVPYDYEWVKLKRTFIYLVFIGICTGLFLIVPAYAIVDPQSDTIQSPGGFFDISCNAEGARVYLDTEFQGFIEDGRILITISTMADPYTSITIEKEGYETYRSQLYAYPESGETIYLHVPMNQNPYDGMGTVKIEGDPVGIGVTMDGISQGLVPDSGVMILTNIPSGNHQFSFELAGFQTQTKEEYVNIGAVTRITILMMTNETGILSVSSQPPGADVYLDNVYKGITPLLLTDLSTKTYILLIVKDGFSDWTKTVSVTGGDEQHVGASLIPADDRTQSGPIKQEQQTKRSGHIPLIVIAAVCLLGMYLAQKREK